MIYKILEVVDSVGTVDYVEESEVVNSTIKRRFYEEDGESYYNRQISVIIQRTLLVYISAEFVPANDGRPMMMDAGFMTLNGLAFFYSIVIMDITSTGSKIYIPSILHSESGVRRTEFGMYSYHTNDPLTYHINQVLYEIRTSINFKEVVSV